MDGARDLYLELLGERLSLGVTLLCDAVRLDFARFLGEQVEERLLARPNLLRRTAQAELVKLRVQLEDVLGLLVARTEKPVHALRAELRDTPGADEPAELAAFADVLRPIIVNAARGMLTSFKLPGDGNPDFADHTISELHPHWALDWQPSPSLGWAFRQVRRLDRAMRQLRAADGDALPRSLELCCFLPEGVPDEA